MSKAVVARFSRIRTAVVAVALFGCLTGCGFVGKLTRMPAGAGRELPPPTIEERALAVGTRAPAIVLDDHRGETFSLEEATKAGPVVVVFFRGEWCPLCARQLIELRENQAALDATGATVVALHPDSPELTRAFAKDIEWPYPILIDADRSVIKSYGVYDAENNTAWPTIYIVDAAGVIRYRGLSETKAERPTSKHVLAALKAVAPRPNAPGDNTRANAKNGKEGGPEQSADDDDIKAGGSDAP